MRVIPATAEIGQCPAEAVVISLFADGPLEGPAARVDQASGGLLARLREAGELAGKANELTPLYGPAGLKSGLALVLGLGPRDQLGRQVAFRGASAAARWLAARQRKQVAFYLSGLDAPDLTESAIAGALAGCRGQDLYRAEKKRSPFEELLWAGATDETIRRGTILGESINLTRELVNEPPQVMYPESFAVRAATVAGECGLELEIWDERKLEQERAGALLAVGQGSTRPPRLVIVRHRGAAADAPWLAIVGKGVTFDSGGLSLKPNDSMKTMKCDMAGAATMLGALRAISLLRLPVNVMGLAGLVENMPSGSAMKLGDVLTARNGRTIEVMNTDAEGRLVLADVLDVAVTMGASRIVDLATLTGACVVALGIDVAGLMSNDRQWSDQVLAAAGACGERLWPLPMFPEYRDDILSEVADIRNTGEGRWAGAIAGAKFLEEFVAGKPWAHLDIAGPAFMERPKPWLDAGGSGVMVRTLVELATRMSAEF